MYGIIWNLSGFCGFMYHFLTIKLFYYYGPTDMLIVHQIICVIYIVSLLISPPVNRPAHEILVLSAYAQKPSLITHADVSSETRGLHFGLSLHLHSYFVYVSRKGSSKPIHLWRLT